MSQTSKKTTKKSSLLASNPVMRRLDKVDETAESQSASYGGITIKTIYFLLFTLVGMILHPVLAGVLSTGGQTTVSIRGFEVDLFYNEIFAILGVAILGLVFQLLATFARPTTPVTGALYSVSQGYFISFLVFKVLKAYEMEYLGLLALAITVLIVLIMSILYSTGVIRVTKKFKMVLFTLLITSVAVSLLMFIGSFIPFTRGWVAQLQSNLPFTITVGVIFIIIAALFLICDFATIDHVVNDKLPKKYEWAAAFGLAFTVIWLYLKVLDLIMTIAGSKKN